MFRNFFIISGRVLSEGKETGQSSTGYGGDSSRAVDGIWNPDYGHNSCTHTNADNEPYWWVDLGKEHSVSTVLLQNRADCCGM